MSKRQKGLTQTAHLPIIRMYPAELEYVRKCAKDANLTLSEYVRSQLATPHIVDLPNSPIAPNQPIHNASRVAADSCTAPEKVSSQIANSNEAKPLHAPSFVNETVARKMGHQTGCDCVHCERIRKVLSTSKPPTRDTNRKR